MYRQNNLFRIADLTALGFLATITIVWNECKIGKCLGFL